MPSRNLPLFTLTIASMSVGFALSFEARPALACSPPQCTAGEVFPNAGLIPSNAVVFFEHASILRSDLVVDGGSPEDALRVYVEGGDAGDERLTLRQEPIASGDQALAGAETAWHLDQAEPGTTLRVERTDACTGETTTTHITLTDSVKTPQRLGELEVETHVGPLDLWTSSGSCTAPTLATYADVRVDLSTEAEAYAQVLRYRLWVDDDYFASDDWVGDWGPNRGIGGGGLGRGVERVYAVCDASNEDALGKGVTPGTHTIQMRALLPDGGVVASEERALDLGCPTPDAGESSTTGSPSHGRTDSGETGSGETASSRGGLDAGSTEAATTDRGSSDVANPAPTESKHSSCELARETPPQNVFVATLALAIGLAWSRLRKR